MTVRITSRDQITGADKGKLNALFAAVEALGGTIDYSNGNEPAETEPLPNGWQVSNANYANQSLNYNGGLIELNPSLTLDTPIQIGQYFEFKLPAGSFVRVMALVNQTATANMTDYPNNFFGDGVGMSASGAINMNVDGTVDPDKLVFGANQYLVKGTILEDGINFNFYDADNNFVVAHTINKSFHTEQPLYFHLVADLYNQTDNLSLPISINFLAEA